MMRPFLLALFLTLIAPASFAHEALQRAACEGRVDEVARLLEQPEVLREIDVYAPNPPLHIQVNPFGCAAMKGHDAVVKLLLEKGASLEARPADDDRWWSIMDALVLQRSRPALNATLGVVLEYTRQNRPPDKRVGGNWMALLLHPRRPWDSGGEYAPTDEEAASTAKVLLDAGAKPGSSSVGSAAWQGWTKTLTLLLDAGGPLKDAVQDSAYHAQPATLALALSRVPTEERAALAQAALERFPGDRRRVSPTSSGSCSRRARGSPTSSAWATPHTRSSGGCWTMAAPRT